MHYRSVWQMAATASLVTLSGATSAAQVEQFRGWNVEQTVTALTGATRVTAVLNSSEPLINMIGQPQNATLVLRCQERVLVMYLSWPEVVNTNFRSFGGRPQTMVLWRTDQQPIAANFWQIDTAGIAAGMFDTKAATKLIGKLWGANQLVVRMSGKMTQDAVFDLAEFRTVAARVGAPCGVTWTPNK